MCISYVCAKPLVSLTYCEARTRALGLYRAWYRFLPYYVRYFDIPKTEGQCRAKLREYFYKNKEIIDPRVIDVLVIKGYMSLCEFRHNWAQKSHAMDHFKPTAEPRPKTFMEKFVAGTD